MGKSVIFSRLTGVDILSANYPGTTIGYTEGRMSLRGEVATLVDAPGTYSLGPSTKAEDVARSIIDQGADQVVNVLDATNLERNLYLTLQVLERGMPTVVALNLWDVAVKKRINIDVFILSRELGVPVIPTVAVSGQGILDLVKAMEAAQIPTTHDAIPAEQRWNRIGEIVGVAQQVEHRHPSILERLEDLTIRP